ncbi:hypothetical protein SEA_INVICTUSMANEO_94 [Mycobacterium phage InvictusManeo]|nr:hypothetical protein SEA_INVICTUSMANEO_94 [Mycobacterium phage InvictusManeo]
MRLIRAGWCGRRTVFDGCGEGSAAGCRGHRGLGPPCRGASWLPVGSASRVSSRAYAHAQV